MQQAAGYINDALGTLHRRYGEAFVFGFGPLRFHWLVGREANRFVLLDARESFRLGPAYDFLRPIVGDTALITSDPPDHLPRRRKVQPAFHGRHLTSWTSTIAERLDAVLTGLAVEGEADLYRDLRPEILAIICEILLGRAALAQAPRLVRDIGRMMDFATLPFLAQLFKIDLPGTPWRSFLRARASADAALYSDVRRRREAPFEASDVVSLLLAGEGEGLSDKEIRDQAVGLVSAGFDTTTAGLAWTMFLILEHPDWRGALEESLAGRDPVDALRDPLFDRIVRESLRLYPPVSAGLRQAAADLRFHGHLIPRGSLVAYSIYLTHRHPDLYPAPLAFRPERWERDPPDAFSYLPFGYGGRYCIGAGLAQTIIKIAVYLLLTRHRPTPGWTSPPRETGITLHPAGGLPVKLGGYRP